MTLKRQILIVVKVDVDTTMPSTVVNNVKNEICRHLDKLYGIETREVSGYIMPIAADDTIEE